jgi:hypothetical protein
VTATPITFDELPQHSRWPAILLGATPFPPRQRSREDVLREYDREKWRSVLAWLQTGAEASSDELLRQQGLDPDSRIAFARQDQFFTAPARVVKAEYDRLLVATLRPHRAETLVELGAGLGDKLLKVARALGPRVIYGGEFTASGVACGRLLARQAGLAAQFEHFDYNDPATLAAVPEAALVYTSHSIEQIPTLLDSFVEGLFRRRPRMVVHLEPCYEDQHPMSIIGLMRRRYAELNDYNRNLVGVVRALEQAGRVRVLEHRRNVFSNTPFNPTSVLIWQPT